jgi:hypothetical protein
MIKTGLIWGLIWLPVIAMGQQRKDTIVLPFRNYRETAYKLLVGANFQGSTREEHQDISRKYVEVGLHRTLTDYRGRHPPIALTYGLSTEILLDPDPIYGFKVSGWATAMLFVLGASTVYYTDFEKGNLRIRPEFGVGMHPFKLTVGYNIPTFWNKEFERMRYADLQVTLNLLLKLKTIKKEE